MVRDAWRAGRSSSSNIAQGRRTWVAVFRSNGRVPSTARASRGAERMADGTDTARSKSSSVMRRR